MIIQNLITLEILVNIDKSIRINCKIKYFYVNINYILNESSEIRLNQYFAFYLTKLFENYESYESFYNELINSLFNKKVGRLRLLYKILKYIIRKTNKNCYIVFDNIYNDEVFEELYKISKNLNKKLKINMEGKFNFCFFVQLNKNTFHFIDDDNKDIHFKFINNDNSIRHKEYINLLESKNYKENYLNEIKNNFYEKMNEKSNVEQLNILIKIKYLPVVINYILLEEVKLILRQFLDFFHITCSNEGSISIKKIDFKNEIIKNFLNKKFYSFIYHIINENKLSILDDLINTTFEGIILEKQIILGLILTMGFKDLKIRYIMQIIYQKIIIYLKMMKK